jgi:hypothetical protein
VFIRVNFTAEASLQFRLDRELHFSADRENVVRAIEVGQRTVISEVEAGEFQSDVTKVMGDRGVQGAVTAQVSDAVASKLLPDPFVQ